MRLTALGVSAAFPGPGEACSGWLAEEGATRIMVDCGSGVMSNLQKHIPYYSINAIIITHMHADHFLDLIPFKYALKYGFPEVEKLRPQLYLPPGGERVLSGMAALIDPAEDFFAQVFDVSEYDPHGELVLGKLSASFAPTLHYTPAFAVALRQTQNTSSNQGSRVVFSADSAPCQGLTDLARGADLLICEATYLSVEEEHTSERGHMTAREAGETAQEAGVRRLILNHLWPHRDRRQAQAQAQAVFSGSVELAQEGKVYTL